jgi:hypothetical protein
MSRRLAAIALVLGILACSMGLKTALSSHSGGAVLIANGPDEVPPGPPPPPPHKP